MTETGRAPTVPPGLGLGCWQFGDMGWGPSDAQKSIALIREAFGMGIRHLDTAQGYGGGRSEEVIGEAVAPFSADVFVSSKAHATGRGEPPEIVENTLRRLRRSWLDLFYIHWPRTGLDLRPMMESLEALRSQGKIRFIGVSNFSVKDLENASQGGRVDAYQVCYNLLWRYPEREIIPWCREHEVQLITYSSIAQGLLSDTPRSPSSFEKGDDRAKTLYYRKDVWPHVRDSVAAMRDAAARHGTPLSTLALRWVLGREGVVSSLVGARSKAHLEANVAAASGRNSSQIDEELTRLSSEAMRHIPDVGNIFNFFP
jgi:aryl-alcohol dehydrogenase-like predicted oxidoreductase